MKTIQTTIIWVTCLLLTVVPAHAQLVLENDSDQISRSTELEEVVVRARKWNVESSGLGNMRINTALLKTTPTFLGERDVVKTLQMLPGVSSGMDGSSQIVIRGGTNDQTLYLMDDVPVYNQNHTFGLFSIFNADVVNSAELYKGGIPVKYGDKLSGVVGVSLKDGDFRNYHHSASVGMLAGTLASEGPVIKDKLSYAFAGRRSFIDLLIGGFMALNGEGGMPTISFYDVNGKVSWKINPQNRLSWQIYTGFDAIGVNNRDVSGWSNDEVFKQNTAFGWRTTTTSLRYMSDLSPEMTLTGNLYYTGLNNFNYYKQKLTTPNVTQEKDRGNNALLAEFGGKANVSWNINNAHHLHFGLEASHQSYIPEKIYEEVDHHRVEQSFDRLNLLKVSGYAYDEYRKDRWLISPGLRLALYHSGSKTKPVIEPRLKINYFVGEKDKLMFAYDQMYQPTHSVNEFNYNVQTEFWIPFQENILPRSHQVSLGWKHYATPNLNFSAEAYAKSMRNLLLIRDLENYLDYHTNYDTGHGSSIGLELMAEYTANKLNAWASYTLSRSRRTFGGKTFPFKYDTPHDISAFASYEIHRRGRYTNTLSLSLQYKSGMPYYVPNVSYPSVGLPTLPSGYTVFDKIDVIDYVPQYPNMRLNDYFRADLNFTIEQRRKRGSVMWQFSLLNATNHTNPYVVYRKGDRYKAYVLIPLMPSIAVKRVF